MLPQPERAIIERGGVAPPGTLEESYMAAPAPQEQLIEFGDELYTVEQFSAKLLEAMGYIRAHVEGIEQQLIKINGRVAVVETVQASVLRRNAAMDAGGCPLITELRKEMTADREFVVSTRAKDAESERIWNWLRPIIISAGTALMVAILTLMLANSALFLKH